MSPGMKEIRKSTKIYLSASKPGKFCDDLHALAQRVSKFQTDHPTYLFKYISLDAENDHDDGICVVLNYTYERPMTALEQRKEELKQKGREQADIERLHELAKKYNWPIPPQLPQELYDSSGNVMTDSELRMETNRKIIEETNRLLNESVEAERVDDSL